MEIKYRVEMMARGKLKKLSKIFKCHDFLLSTMIRAAVLKLCSASLV